MADLQDDLPTAMTMAAFIGIAWYIGVEINISLLVLFKRRTGLYFWSCALASWGVILQPLCIILADFGVWTDLKAAIPLIYLTWFIMVVPQSWVLYSRLHLIMQDEKERYLEWVKAVLIFDSIVFSVPTIVIGTLAQTTTTNPHLFAINMIWDRIQFIVFFVQETALSLLYILQSRKYLRSTSLLDAPSSVFHNSTAASERRQVLHHLIYMNMLIIGLDSVLLGIQGAGLFYLQGAFKPCVYGIKLKAEFVILNRLIKSVRARGQAQENSGTVSWRRTPAKMRSSSNGTPVWTDDGGTIGNNSLGNISHVQLADLPIGSGQPWLRSQESRSPILGPGRDGVGVKRVEGK